ncbi:MAG: lysophospholipid acyltransferase family protein [Fimbriimonadales bacterium]|nr:lysophospholipid acyltransferase family protein [Fimbriimonadales bacterium]
MERAGLSSAVIRLQARFVDWLIGRSLRAHFRAVYVRGAPPSEPKPLILYANHHYWWDGYLGYWLIRSWGRRPLAWMEAYRRFPPFGAVGALPFPPDDAAARARTVRCTLKRLQSPDAALLLFPEGVLHGDTERLLPFQRSLHWLAQRVPEAVVLPLAMYIEPSYHQYPRAYLRLGEPFVCNAPGEEAWLRAAAQALEAQLHALRAEAKASVTEAEITQRGYRVLIQGRLSVHERF